MGAPVPPRAVPWSFADSHFAFSVLQGFLASDVSHGTYVAIPDPAFANVFCTDLRGAVVAGAPSATEVHDRGYNAPEPLYGALELVGELGFARPEVAAGLFGPDSGTSLQVVSFEQDFIIAATEAAMVYEYLTGDGSGGGLVEVGGAASDHDTYLTDAPAVVHALRER